MPANPKIANGTSSPIGIHASSTTQYHRVGTRGELGDRAFRYYRLSNATGVVSNNLCQAAVPVAAHVSETGALRTPDTAAAAGVVAGSTKIVATLGATAAVQNQYAEGYFKVQAGTGLGQIYKIRAHEAAALSTEITLDLYDPVLTTIASGATWTLIANPWADIIITPVTTRTGMAVGVPSHAIPGATTAAPTFGWMQTWGPCSVLGDTTDITVGLGVTQSVVVGSVTLALENEILDRVGIGMATLTTNTVYQTVYLQIAP